jgi:hypothetical protein
MKKLLAMFVLLGFLAAVPFALANHSSWINFTVSLNEDTSNSTIDLDNYMNIGSGESLVPGSITVSQGTKVTTSVNPTTNVLTVTGKSNQFGVDVITTQAIFQNDSNTSQTWTRSADNTVNIAPVNDQPTLSVAGDLRARANVQFSYQVNGSDVDNNPLTYTFTSSWATFAMQSSGLIQFIPAVTDIGLHDVTLFVSDGALNSSKAVTVMVTEENDDGSLMIDEVEVDDATDDDKTLVPGDILAVSFDVENKLTSDVDGIETQAWLENTDGKRLTDKIEFDSFDLEDKDTQTLDFEVQVPFDVDDKDYVVLVMLAEGEEKNNNSVKSARYMQKLLVEREDHDVAFEAVNVNPSSITCGSAADISVNIWNVGSDDEDITVKVRHSELGIDAATEKFNLKDTGSNADALKTLSVIVPKNVKPGNYSLTVSATYNKDKSTESTAASMEVLCSTYVDTGDDEPAVDAGQGLLALESTDVDGVQGQQSKVKATLRNTGQTAAVYTFELTGLGGWATGYVEPDTLTLASGASSDVFAYITPKSSATGENTATLSVKSGNAVIETETISVHLPDRPKLSISSLGTPGAEDSTALFLVLIGVLAAFVLILAGKKYASGNGIQIYGKSKKK